jgi:hypothetical protein
MRPYAIDMHSDGPIRDCEFRPLSTAGSFYCPFCGFKIDNIDPSWPPLRKNCPVRTRWALGDRVSYYLRRAGITKDRWRSVVEYLSPYEDLPSVQKRKKRCRGCDRRQEVLNQIGDAMLLRWWTIRGWLGR